MEHSKIVKYSMSLRDFENSRGDSVEKRDLPITTFMDWMLETDIGKSFLYDFMEDYKRKKYSNEKIFVCEKCGKEKKANTDLNIISCQFGCDSRMIAIENVGKGDS